MAKNKFYVVWYGLKPGVYSSWDACKKQVEGVQGARYKGFPDRMKAERALEMGYEQFKNATGIDKISTKSGTRPIEQSIAVDAACSGNPGKMEYRGVFTLTGTEIFRSKVYEQGTNNIGEFLAIVHCLAWQQNNKTNYPVYSDSRNAIAWVKAGKAKTKLDRTAQTASLFEVISRAENWLKNNKIHVPILKWETTEWGEIPADFGRK